MPRLHSRSGHLFFALPVRRRSVCSCIHLSRLSHPCPQQSRSFGIGQSLQDNFPNRVQDGPRWQATPPRTVAPGASPRLRSSEHHFPVNNDPERLDRVLARILGQDGDQMLTDQVKWLAVTHKSFDHGKRGFNDRLAFLGMPLFDKAPWSIMLMMDNL